MRVNGAKARAKAGEVALGAVLPFNSPDLVELLGVLGFDFVTLDLEHDPFDELAIVHCIRAAEAYNITPIVRLSNDENLILRILDAGAQGIHVARINTARDAQLVVDAVRFYPQGKRTFYATGRSGNYGLGTTDEDHAEHSNRETLVILQVEEEEGLRNLDAILSVPYVDAVQVGPKDLWQSMGMPDRQVVAETVDRVLTQVSSAGKWGSMYVWVASDIRKQVSRYVGLGVRLVAIFARELLIDGAQRHLTAARQAAQSRIP
jgi:4-hydroxy-2-oxoheptanedioate aldolase